MPEIKEDNLSPIIVDLTMASKGAMTETALRALGDTIKIIMRKMFGGSSIGGRSPGSGISVRGNRTQVKDFYKALHGEKRYMQSWTKFGLDNPKTIRSKYHLNKAIRNFERSTGIKWPFK